MTKQKFKKHLIQLVVDNDIALTVLSSPALQSYLEKGND